MLEGPGVAAPSVDALERTKAAGREEQAGDAAAVAVCAVAAQLGQHAGVGLNLVGQCAAERAEDERRHEMPDHVPSACRGRRQGIEYAARRNGYGDRVGGALVVGELRDREHLDRVVGEGARVARGHVDAAPDRGRGPLEVDVHAVTGDLDGAGERDRLVDALDLDGVAIDAVGDGCDALAHGPLGLSDDCARELGKDRRACTRP